ncbi:MAG: N-acetylmuramic acid 6-phosphate etherase [Armatimonadota bacterium]|nr:N-acetylmuramic acid 6-phosphate etherase [Armatimonadota bacterium]MDW8155685.1 N-acetylmuramic acid 6-phosphate etherase [Armatimonadota bacterium]
MRRALEELETEQSNPRSTDLDRLPTDEVVRLINEEDASVAAAVREALPAVARAAELVAERLSRGGRVFYVGAGTSGRMGWLDAVEWGPTFGVDPGCVQVVVPGGVGSTVEATSELEDDAELGARDLRAQRPTPRDVVVGIAASGRTPYVLGALQAAREAGCAVVVVCNNPGSPMEAMADVAVVVRTGPEVLAGSTRMKAGTAQKMVLNMLSTAAMVRLGKVYRNLMVDVQPLNRKLAARAVRIVAEAVGVPLERAAELLERAGHNAKVAIVMGRAGCSREEAVDRLRRAGGRVRAALGEA